MQSQELEEFPQTIKEVYQLVGTLGKGTLGVVCLYKHN